MSLAPWMAVVALSLPISGLAQHQAGPPGSTARPAAALSPAIETSHPAQRLYRTHRLALVQIHSVLRSSGTETGSGSGFVVRPDGTAITNFHVVAAALRRPEEQQLRYTRSDGTQGEAELAGIDVVHDLAVLRLAQPPGGWPATMALRLATAPPALGEPLFALGNPMGLGFTVVPGSFSGVANHHWVERWHFTGALNPGMSGGPVLDAAGRVAGVNVARINGAQLVSFIVPPAPVLALLAGRSTEGAGPPGAVASEAGIARPGSPLEQARAHHVRWTQALQSSPWPRRRLGGFDVPVLPPQFGVCQGREPDAGPGPYRRESLVCRSRAEVWLAPGEGVGRLQIGVGAVRLASNKPPSQIDLWRLTQWVAQGETGVFPLLGALDGAPRGQRCEAGFVRGHGDLQWRVRVCGVADDEWTGLWHLQVHLASLPVDGEVLAGAVALDAADWPGAVDVVLTWLQSIRRTAESAAAVRADPGVSR